MELENSSLITDSALKDIFPEDIADNFFDALYGDAEDGAYDIYLKYKDYSDKILTLEFHLVQRPGKCLVCNLTYGLPKVFSKHPIININKIVKKIEALLEDKKCASWELGRTLEISRELHIIPLLISVTD